MKLKRRLLTILMITLTSTLLIFTACEDDEPANRVPICTITSPDDGDEFRQGQTVTIAVEAEDEDNNLEEVRFYVNGNVVGSANSFPYNFDWDTSEEEAGTFIIRAEAIDDEQEKVSDEISITLVRGGSGETVTDIDGNVYSTVQIGDQVWMGENLKTITYNDGISIDLIENNTDWDNNTTGAYCWYDNDEDTYAGTYGALYNWYAVNTDKLCPDGWHVSTDEEWKTLEMELGMSQTEANEQGWRGTNEGSKLAGNAGLWDDGSLEDDSEFGNTGFTALPGGGRRKDGTFYYVGGHGNWWTATEHSSLDGFYRELEHSRSYVNRSNYRKARGFSVRCVKD